MTSKNLFVCSIDGPDFCGKTTIASLLIEELRKRFPKYLIKRTHLPSELITGAFTKILRNSSDKVSDEVFALVYAADHLHHDKTFVSKLRKLNNVILVQERSLLSTFLYHGFIGKADMGWIREINKYDRNIPNVQIILKLELEELLKRKGIEQRDIGPPENSSTEWSDTRKLKKIEQRDFDKFETEKHLKKQTEVYYNLPPELIKEFNVELIDAKGQPESVTKRCADIVAKKLDEQQDN